MGNLSAYEKELLKAALPELASNIKKGVDFGKSYKQILQPIDYLNSNHHHPIHRLLFTQCTTTLNTSKCINSIKIRYALL